MFQYTVLPGDLSPFIDLDRNRSSIEYKSNSSSISNAINELQSSPEDANVSIDSILIVTNDSQAIEVDTSPPSIKYISMSGNSVSLPLFHVGDVVCINVTFDQSIFVSQILPSLLFFCSWYDSL